MEINIYINIYIYLYRKHEGKYVLQEMRKFTAKSLPVQ
jgi:hypothetical protein